jgi:hypothetical protein
MKTLGNLRKLRGRTIALTLLCLTVAILAGLPAYSQAQTSQTTALPCGWPVESTGSGLTNVAFPDTDATYWLMPIDTSRWQSMVVKGEYPKSRFFSFVTYFGTGGAADSIIDANIEPDAGSSNPFTSGPAGDAQNYTLTIDGNANGAGNHIQWANTQLTYVLYRIYVADEGQSRNAGVPLPSVELVDNQGNAHPIQACKLQNLAGQLPGLNDLVGSGASACPSTQAQQQQQVTFSANTSGDFFPIQQPSTFPHEASASNRARLSSFEVRVQSTPTRTMVVPSFNPQSRAPFKCAIGQCAITIRPYRFPSSLARPIMTPS